MLRCKPTHVVAEYTMHHNRKSVCTDQGPAKGEEERACSYPLLGQKSRRGRIKRPLPMGDPGEGEGESE